MPLGFATFATPLGPIALAWGERGLVRIELPARDAAEAAARLVAAVAGAQSIRPPGWVRDTARRLALHLGGEPQDLGEVPLDLTGLPDFHRRVYQAARGIGPGTTASYGELAVRAGAPAAARAVGQAMAKNPFPLVVPCHRVLAAGGRAGGFSAPGGAATKLELLALEGVHLGRARSMFGRGFDPAEALARLSEADPTLGRVIELVGAFALRRQAVASPFESLARAIVYQQLSGRAAATILGRLRDRFPGRRLDPERLLALDDETLRACGVSRPKAAGLRDLARKTLDGTVPDLAALGRMSDDEIVTRLTRVRGVGRWTVEMMLIFRLGRPDVLPVDDYGVRKGFARAFGRREPPAPRDLAAHGDRWRPFRSVASWYLWRACDQEGQL